MGTPQACMSQHHLEIARASPNILCHRGPAVQTLGEACSFREQRKSCFDRVSATCVGARMTDDGMRCRNLSSGVGVQELRAHAHTSVRKLVAAVVPIDLLFQLYKYVSL